MAPNPSGEQQMSPNDRITKLEGLLDDVLRAADVDRSEIDLRLDVTGGDLRAMVGRETIGFPLDDPDWQLEWERLAMQIVHRATCARLHRISRSRGENRLGAWSVLVSTFTFDWLAWNAGGNGTSAWDDDVETLITAADEDDEVVIHSRFGSGLEGLRGQMRGRRLFAIIDLGKARYRVRDNLLTADAVIPATAVMALSGNPLGRYLDHPAVRKRTYELREVSVSPGGTEFALRECWLPLVDDEEPMDDLTGPGPPWELTEQRNRHIRRLMLRGSRSLAPPRAR